MTAHHSPRRGVAPILACVSPVLLLTVFGVGRLEAQEWYLHAPGCAASPPVYAPNCPAPYPTPPAPPPMPRADTTPPTTTPPSTTPPATTPETTAPTPEVQTDTEGSGARGTETVALSPGGYIDDAIPQTLFRLRYDDRFNINRFDRASFMYGTWREGSFHPHALVGNNNNGIRGTFFDPKATGSQIISDDIDDQILSAYTEFAFNERLSAFVDLPFRFVHFGPSLEDEAGESAAERNQFKEILGGGEVRNAKSDTAGLSDIEAGFKYALIAETNSRYVTFQFTTFIPTGDPGLGLGTGHYSLEPGLLAYQRLSDRLVVQGELKDWIPIAAGQGAGNVLTFGGGIGYDLIQRCNFRLTPVAEVVGWTVLGGTEAFDGTVPGTVATTPAGVQVINVNGTLVPPDHGFLEANGDTIVNLKLGVRTYFGERSDLYLGWGHALTGSRWYEDIARVEYRIHF